MPPWIIALVFGLFAIAAVWGIYRSLVTGVANDGTRTVKADQSPVGFLVVLFVKLLVLCFAVAVVLHAVGLSAFDPIISTRKMLPSFLSQSDGTREAFH